MTQDVPFEAMPSLDGRSLWRRLEQIVAIGNRFAGSEGEARCRELILAEFERAGLSNVRAEPFPYLGYEPASASCEVLGDGTALRCTPLQYSADAVAEGEAVYLGSARPEDLEALDARGVALAGKVAVAHSFMPWLVTPALAERGVAALVNVTETGDGLIPNFMVSFYPNGMDAPWDGRIQPLPGVTIETSDARRLISLMSAETIRLRVTHRANYVEASSANVVAEIVGRELPEERVVIGAHYDTQLEGVGAADNSTGIAALLEIGERWAELEPRRTLVFCAFGVEELASWGAYHYCRTHVDALTATRGMINLDALGLPLPGRRVVVADAEMAPYAVESAARTGYEIEDEIDASAYAWSDHNPFIDAGVPAVWIWRFPPQHPYYHSAGDVLRYVDAERVLDVATASAYLAFRIAEAETVPLGRSRPVKRFIDLRPSP
ncbi:MAG: M28 family peptidase [Gaiellaceae bacterium]